MEYDGDLRFKHQSFVDFLLDLVGCPPEFQVETKRANVDLSVRCLVTMANGLQFNICRLETSCTANTDILDLKDRVEEGIPDALQYSCMHWSNHLCYDIEPVNVEVTKLLDGFFAESQPLYWLEVLSLTGKMPVAITALRLMKTCFRVCMLLRCNNAN
jgi:hypothetical protein